MQNRKKEWEKSYNNKDNHLFSPNEEYIRFISKFIRKRVGLNTFFDIDLSGESSKILDLGCGIGRHVVYCHELGLEVYGIDLSETAISLGRNWGSKLSNPLGEKALVQGDICSLPWKNQYFRYATSHAVLDSMPFDMARAAVVELARVMQPGGLFYCDLISGDNSKHGGEFTGEEIVETDHENSTVQLYFNRHKINCLFEDLFEIRELYIVRRENILTSDYTSRYHIVLFRK